MKNRPLKLITNYNSELGDIFSIFSLVRTSMTSFPAFTLLFVQKYSNLFTKENYTVALKIRVFNYFLW